MSKRQSKSQYGTRSKKRSKQDPTAAAVVDDELVEPPAVSPELVPEDVRQVTPQLVEAIKARSEPAPIQAPLAPLPRKDSVTNMSDDHRNLSKKLYDILEHVGGSEAMRKLHQTSATTREIITTMTNHLYQQHVSRFIFGSFWEGTTTPGLHSDTDILLCHDARPAIENIDDAAGHDVSFLMVRDDHTQPGYVKLQVVGYGIPCTVYNTDMNNDPQADSDCNGRICRTHISECGDDIDGIKFERNGPADTDIRSHVDYVLAYRCASVPKYASEWIRRPRLYGWPSRHMIDQMKASGCFVVRIGHPASVEKHIEWRLSFSLQERQLMFCFNTVQHKCYILLKMIKKDLIERELGKSISSYHCKTCMFHVIENTPVSIWRPENLLSCVRRCLFVMLKFVENGFCPNYFIQEENMFDRDVHRIVKPRLMELLRSLIVDGPMLLFGIKCDQIGDILLDQANFYLVYEASIEHSKRLKLRIVLYQSDLREIVNRAMKENDLLSNYRCYSALVQNVTSGTYFKDHNEQQTRDVFPYLISFLHYRLAQQLISLVLRSPYNALTRDRVLRSYHHFLDGCGCDMTSSPLVIASAMYKFGLYDRCERLLDQITAKLQPDVPTVCSCTDKKCAISLNDKPAGFEPSSLSSTASCVVFLPSEATLAPPPLQYEMYRSVGTPPGSRDEEDDFWYDFAVVDGIVYLHVLKCLVYSSLNKLIHKRVAIGNLRRVIQNEANLGHRETGYNVLGWLYVQENRVPEAVQCLLESWRIKPQHNAAKWHLGILLYGLFRNQR